MSGDTIRVCGTGSVLIGAEGRSPPLPFITVDAGEGRALIAQKLAIEVTDDLEVQADDDQGETNSDDDQGGEPAGDTAGQGSGETDSDADQGEGEGQADDDQGEGSGETDSDGQADDDQGEGNSDQGQGGEPNADRAQLIADALELVDADGLAKSGPRKGKPTVDAMRAITDLTDLTAAEIDAAVAAREPA